MLLNIVGEKTEMWSRLYICFGVAYRPSVNMDRNNKVDKNSKDT